MKKKRRNAILNQSNQSIKWRVVDVTKLITPGSVLFLSNNISRYTQWLQVHRTLNYTAHFVIIRVCNLLLISS